MRISNDYLHSLMLKAVSKTFARKREEVNGVWTDEKTLTLSFDCDYSQDMTACMPILETLKLNGVPACFALVGKLVKEHPKIVESILSGGHEIINHTYSHFPEFKNLPAEKKLEEIVSFQNLIQDSFGVAVKGFRAPHLRTSKQQDLFVILKRLSLFDSSLIGYGIKEMDGVIEIPLTPFPDVKRLPFCTYHHFRMPLFQASVDIFMKRWKRLLLENNFINVYLDPIDFVNSNQLLSDIIGLAFEYGFSFSKLQDVAKRIK